MPFPVDEHWIHEAEAELGKRFPDAYRDRLMRDNGGEFEAYDDSWQLYPVHDKTDRKRIKRTCNHVLLETESARSWAGFPQTAVAIAHNGSGDLLVLLPDQGDSASLDPQVHFWNHETRELDLVAPVSEVLA